MVRKNLSFLVPVGSLALAAGLSVHLWAHSRYGHFIAGFLIGISLVFLIAGVAVRPRTVSK
jgi:hypothetical protein